MNLFAGTRDATPTAEKTDEEGFTVSFVDDASATQFIGYWLRGRGSYGNTPMPLRYRFWPCTPEGQRVSLVELRARLGIQESP